MTPTPLQRLRWVSSTPTRQSTGGEASRRATWCEDGSLHPNVEKRKVNVVVFRREHVHPRLAMNGWCCSGVGEQRQLTGRTHLPRPFPGISAPHLWTKKSSSKSPESILTSSIFIDLTGETRAGRSHWRGQKQVSLPGEKVDKQSRQQADSPVLRGQISDAGRLFKENRLGMHVRTRRGNQAPEGLA